MNELTEAMQDLPLAGLVPLILAIIVGIILWLAGRRVLRAAFALLGLIIGLSAGWTIASVFNLPVPPWIAAAVLGVVLAFATALMYRPAMAMALALVCGIGAPMAVVAIAEVQHAAVPIVEEGEGGAVGDLLTRSADELDEFFGKVGEPAEGQKLTVGDFEIDPELAEQIDAAIADQLPITEEGAETLKQAKDHGQRLLEAGKEWWEQTPGPLRPTIIAAAVVGLIVGMLLGTLAPSLSAVAVSSFGGSLLWLSGLRVLLIQLGGPTSEWLPTRAAWLLVIWLIISLIGVAIQWIFRPKPADKPG